ncbi:MAG TPA: class I SAM-dependent methyltransferase [Labilithrix sp.]|jgi:ubiquinone/menaquinone biosynthesis C-methylase UbiE
MSANADFIAVWNEILLPKFKRFRHVFVVGAEKHSGQALARHAPAKGARVLDVGCGFGETTIDLAKRTGAPVLGLDCCQGMLDIAAADAHAARADVSFVCGDAQTHRFDAPFDYLFARFGTMFFAAPKAAMKNLRASARPGAKLVALVWAERKNNPCLEEARAVALRHLPPPPEDGRTCGPGPFSWADVDVARAILEGAGWTDVSFERVDADILVGRTIEEAIDFAMELGPAGEIVREAKERGIDKRDEVVADLRAAFAPYLTPAGVVMASSSWCITATNPG